MEANGVENSCNILTNTPLLTPTPNINTPARETTLLADNGASDSIFRASDSHLLTNITSEGGKQVMYPGGETHTSIGSATFKGNHEIPDIPVQIFSDADLRQSLVAMSDYTRRGCAIILTEDAIRYTTKASIDEVLPMVKVTMMQPKVRSAKLWTVPISNTPRVQTVIEANNVVRNQLDANFVAWWHASLGSPTISSLCAAIHRGALRNIERLTTRRVQQNPPHTIATAMGHLDLTRGGQQSTNLLKQKHNKTYRS